MRTNRIFLLIGVAVVVFAVFGGSATVGQDGFDIERRPSGRPSARQSVEPSELVADLGLEVARLRERLERNPVPQDISRNPFLLIPNESSAASASPLPPRNVTPRASSERVGVSSEERQTFTFIGVASEDDERAAIFLLGDGRVIVVGAGEVIANGHRVGVVEEIAATVMDSNGVLRRHELR